MPLKYTAPEHVRDAIAALGRTEDVKFSPSNQRLAVAGFIRNRITIFDISITNSLHGKNITISDVVELSSSYLKSPHGVDFIDEDKIIVANRRGDATIFELPQAGRAGACYDLVPLELIRCGDIMTTPGAVSITRNGKDCEALICNNFGNKLTRHLIKLGEVFSIKSNEILLKKWLDLPDGVSVSPPWIAISNHDGQNVLLFDTRVKLTENRDPDGILRCAYYPHGLRFSSDGNFLLVADAGSPYVHVYTKDGLGWHGVRSPFTSVKVLSDEEFLRGRTSIHEGGPKGLDIDSSMTTLVTTCEVQNLAFVDFEAILELIILLQNNPPNSCKPIDPRCERHYQNQRALEINYELERQHQSKQALAVLTNSRSWRFTAPFRSLLSLVSGHRWLPSNPQ